MIDLKSPRKYFSGRNASFGDDKADIYGKALQAIAERNGGNLTAEEVVHSAKLKTNALHDAFDWNDKTAAHEHRKNQARRLMRVIVVREQINGEVIDMPAFTSVKIDVQDADTKEPKQVRVYMPEGVIRNDEYLHQQTISDALRRIKFWRDRYGTLKELRPIMEAIDQVEIALGKKENLAAG